MDKYRHLRQVYLDLLGRIPRVEEYALMDEKENVDEDLIAQLQQSEEYSTQIRKYHRRLLWGTLEPVEHLFGRERTINYNARTEIWSNFNSPRRYRGRQEA